MHRLGALLGRKTKLEQAVEAQASGMNDAQREIVMSQLRDLRRNGARITKIDDALRAMDMQPASDADAARVSLAQRTALVAERGKLAEANDAIKNSLFGKMGDAG